MYPNALLNKVYYVDPQKINKVTSLPVKPKKGSSFFLDGDWDREAKNIESVFNNDCKYKTAREIIIENQLLSDTSEFKHAQKEIDDSGSYRGYKNPDKYIYSVAKLYSSILNDGYSKRTKKLNPWIGEIEIALGRSGDLVKMNSGNHRFACAYLLGLKEVPINLCVVHADYRNILEEKGVLHFNQRLAEIINEK